MNRIFIDNRVGNLLCSDISQIIDNKRELISEEIDVENEIKDIFEGNDKLTMVIWNSNGQLNLATNDKGHTRQIRVKAGLFSKFYKEIDKPAKGGGYYRLSISDDKYSGSIISGPINEKDKRDFENRIDIIETQIIPKLMKLTNGEIIKERIGFNV